MLLVIGASLLSGLMGVVITLLWESQMSHRRQKLDVFKTLLSYRGYIVAEPNLRALNSIDVVFYNERVVRVAFKAFIDAANAKPYEDQRLLARYLKLLECMAKALNYKGVDWTRINECFYLPQGALDRIREEELLRKASLQNQMAIVQERVALQSK